MKICGVLLGAIFEKYDTIFEFTAREDCFSIKKIFIFFYKVLIHLLDQANNQRKCYKKLQV